MIPNVRAKGVVLVIAVHHIVVVKHWVAVDVGLIGDLCNERESIDVIDNVSVALMSANVPVVFLIFDLVVGKLRVQIRSREYALIIHNVTLILFVILTHSLNFRVIRNIIHSDCLSLLLPTISPAPTTYSCYASRKEAILTGVLR